ncbi:hypothetical protein UlMin_023786 [Ulmus minor]
MGSTSGELESSNSQKKRKAYQRYNIHQKNQLEEAFKVRPHPDDNQRRQLGRQLGLETKQISFWFQNKRNQTKVQHGRVNNFVLRSENARIQCENLAMSAALKNMNCLSCGGPPLREEERRLELQKLLLENAQLNEEHQKVSHLVAKYVGKPISHIETMLNNFPRSSSSAAAAAGRHPENDQSFEIMSDDDELMFLDENIRFDEMEKVVMAEIAANAMKELIKLLQANEPLWVKSPSEGRFVLRRDKYENIFPRNNHFKTSTASFETSKDSGIVKMNALDLIDTLLDSGKWTDLFSTIVSKAKTIQVLEKGVSGSRHGYLEMMNEKMHILSPLVLPREFFFLRHCQQIEVGTWVIADVSYKCSMETMSSSLAWRFPSGCMIQELTNGCTRVTWIEHVEVDDKAQTHRLYRDLVCNGIAYGAERWIVTLQRMCERFSYYSIEGSSCNFRFTCDVTHLINIVSGEGKKYMMENGHRMIRNFCKYLSMSGKLDFAQLSQENNGGVRITVRRSQKGEPYGTVIRGASSFWLPIPPPSLFHYFNDLTLRSQWDFNASDHPLAEIARISTGSRPGNCISILQTKENSIVILQETYIDALGSLLVFAPTDIGGLTTATRKDSSCLSLLPSGLIISGDGRANVAPESVASSSKSRPPLSGNSLLTVAFQILNKSWTKNNLLNLESVATVNALVTSTVQRIKVALDCSDLE